MHRPILFIALLLLSVGVANAGEATKTATLYKNPQCGCCESYADYLRDHGFKVTVKPTHDLGAISRQAGVPEDFQGCHTMIVDGYVVDGHVPVNVVNRLLSERPDIRGITLPSMPLGSPGMNGAKTAPFTIYEIPGLKSTGTRATPKVYAVE